MSTIRVAQPHSRHRPSASFSTATLGPVEAAVTCWRKPQPCPQEPLRAASARSHNSTAPHSLSHSRPPTGTNHSPIQVKTSNWKKRTSSLSPVSPQQNSITLKSPFSFTVREQHLLRDSSYLTDLSVAISTWQPTSCTSREHALFQIPS